MPRAAASASRNATSAYVMRYDGVLMPVPPVTPAAFADGQKILPGRDEVLKYACAVACVRPLGMPAYFVGSATVGWANTGMRGSLLASMTFISVCDIRWSSRVWKLPDHGLLYTPSPGHAKSAMSALDV